MKFTVPSIELQKCLTSVGGVIPSRSTLPILENFLFELSGDNLTITATDLEIAMSVRAKVKGMENGRMIAPAKRLMDTVRALPSTEIVFKAEADGGKIEMMTSNGVYKLTGEPSDNYPTIPGVKGREEIKIDNIALRRVIDKTSFAVSTDELRPAMMGILFQMRKSEVRAVATDGHRLVRFTNSKFNAGKEELEVIIPAKALNLIAKSIENNDAVLTFNDTHVIFTLSNITLISRKIDEKYPNYESVIPLENDKRMVVNKTQILSSVRRTALYASSATHQVRLTVAKGSVSVSAEDVDFGSEAREKLTCEYSGDALEIGFNSTYIIDILSHIDTEDVVLQFSTPTRAAIIQPSQQHEGEDLLMLVMPVRLNS